MSGRLSADSKPLSYRLVLLGSTGCGKTSILKRFLLRKFDPKYSPTVEDLFCKDFDLKSVELKVEFLDTAGSMQFPAMRRLSIATGDAFLLVFAVDDKGSFDALKLCVNEIRELRAADFASIPIVFAGNKIDLPAECRQVSREQVSHYIYCQLPKTRSKFVECSCKDNVNVDAIFRTYLVLAEVRVSCGLPAVACKPGRRDTQPAHQSPDNQPQSDNRLAIERQQQQSCESPTPPSPSPSAQDSRQQKRPSLRRKVALSVRKSCDGSIISSLKNSLVDSLLAADCSRKHPDSTGAPAAAPCYASAKAAVDKEPLPAEPKPLQQQQDSPAAPAPPSKAGDGSQEQQINLETAILIAGDKRNARSKSLFLRSTRRANRDNTDAAECLVT